MTDRVPRSIRTLRDLFIFQCRKKPQDLAYAFMRDSLELDGQLTYSELELKVASLADHLVRLAPHGTRALLLYRPGLDTVSAFWACICAGLIPVPAPPPDPVRRKHSLPRLQAIIDDAQVGLVLSTVDIQVHASELSIGGKESHVEWVVTDRAYENVGTSATIKPSESPLAYLQYTSGSTATPRGVRISHLNVLSQCEALCGVAGVQDDSRSLCWLPYFHDYGLVHGIIAPFYAGIPAYLMSPLTFLRRPLRWLEAIDRWAITHSGAPNFAYESCTEALRQQMSWTGNLRRWTFASCGAEPIHAETMEGFARAFHAHGFVRQAFTPAYGLAEATLVVSAKRSGEEPLLLSVAREALSARRIVQEPALSGESRTLVGCGQPLPGTTVRIVDPVTLAECAPDGVGEIWVASPSTAQGYWSHDKREGDTFQASIQSESHHSYLRTGDLGFLYEGQLFVTGRLKDVIILYGRNIYPNDIERTVQQCHPALRLNGGAALSIEAGRAESLVVLHEVERTQSIDVDAIATAIRQAVLEEHEVPVGSVVVVRSGGLPKTSSGKVQRQAAREAFLSGILPVLGISRFGENDSDVTHPANDATSDGQSPRESSHLESYIQQIVAAHLHVDPVRISVVKPIGTLGIDSLKAGELRNRLEEEFHAEITFSNLLIDWTIRDLAQHLSGGASHETLKRRPPAGKASVVSWATPAPKFPLSFSQQRFWFLEELEPDCRLNNVPVAVRLEGPLNVPALEASLGSLIQRHEALRATFGVQQGEPYQLVAASQPFVLHQRDLRGLEQREYEGLVRAEAGHHFDLINGPLIRATLLRLTDDKHVLVVTCHHLIIDGWSIRLLCKELTRAYEEACSGKPVTLPKPLVQYREFVSWQQKWLSREKWVSQTAYWTRQLQDLPPLLELPADAVRPSVGRHRSRQVSRSLDSDRTEMLDQLCQRVGVTRFMVLTAAFAMLLHRYSGSDDVIVGTPVWNRRVECLESVIGCFVNTVALRFDLSGDPTIEQFLKHVRTVLVEANDHQDLPYEEVVRGLSPQQGGERRPLFTTMIVLEEDPTADLQLREVRATRIAVERVATPVDLALIVYEGPQGIELAVEYDAGLFEQTTVVRLLKHLGGIIDGILEQCQRRLAQVSILTAEERHLLLTEWQGRDVSVPDGFVHDMIKAQADRIPEAFAVVTRQAYLTYRELDRRANQLAQYLRQLGVDRGVLVGLCVERSVDMIVGLLGILKAGAAYVPLDPEYPQERLAFIVRDSRIAVLVTHAHLGERVTFTEERVVYLDSDGPSIARCPDEPPSSSVTTGDPAYVMYTSGSTGEPKGVVVTHRNLVHSTIAREQYYEGRVGRLLLASSPAFDSSVAGIFWTLCQGGSLVIPAESDQRDPEALASWIAQYRITHVAWVPSLYRAVLREHAASKLSSLQVVVVGGESLSLELVHRHYRFLPQATLYNEYGPTETTVWSCVYKTMPHEAGPRVPVGRPICNTRVYVLGPDLQPAPIGVGGEIYIGGGGVASGYLNRPELTAVQFVTHPISGGRLYKTGDRGRFCADGNIEFVGRVDRQVKVRGYRVELGEIESALRQIPVIRDAAVILQDMPGIGPVIIAYVTGESLSDSSAPRLRDHAREKLPGYMVPATFVILESLPMTLSGKVDRLALPGFAQGQIADRGAVAAPRDQVEASLIEMWGKILGRHIESINDNFFDLGGHSLLAMQLISHVREVFGVEVALRRLFEDSTIAQLADCIRDEQRRGRGRAPLPPIIPVSRETSLPLSYSQQRMWFINQLAPQGTAYNMPFASRQTGPLDRTALRRTLDELVRRHESFRTTFAMTGQGPVQIIAPWGSPSWGEIDLRRLPMEQRVQEAVQIVQNVARQSFDLEKGPLVRFLLIQIDTEDHVLVVTMHHIIGDQWSFGVMGREFATLYSAFCDGMESPLPPLPIQYADFAVWQRRCLTDEWLKEQSDYWTKELAHLPTLSLPTDHLRPAVQTFNGSYCVTELPASIIDRLKQFSAQHHATSFMTLLACFQILLSRYSGQTDIPIGSPIANRTQFTVEGLVGTFVNTLVLRTDLSGDPTFEEVIERVREIALGAYANQDFPFERLVETMQTNRDPSYPPLVQVLFNVGNTPIGEIFPRGLTWVPFEVDPGSAQVDLSLTIETEIVRKAYLTFNTDLFERRTAERMLGHYKLLLQSALADPKARISRLPLLSKSEWKQQVQEWNRTGQAYPRSACFHELFEAQVKRSPDAVALSMGRNRLSYNGLNARANQLARFLRNLGVGPGVTVGISLDRSPEMVIALLGVMKAGGTYVPLDPEYPRERIRFMMEDAAAAIVLTACAYADRFAMQAGRIVCLDSEKVSLGREPDHDLVPAARPQDLVYILYTSGSSGQPKGVEVRHGSLVNVLWSMKEEPGCSPQDVWLSVTTLSFDIAGLELFLPLLVGARVEIAERAVVMDGRKLQACLEAVQPTIMQATPATWRLLIDTGWAGSPRLAVLCGGETLPRDLADKLLDRTRALWNMYGPTETTIWSTTAKIDRGEQDITIGRPIANTDVYILDHHMCPVPVGVAGELYIGGHGLARGYHHRPELTEERFVSHPFSDDPHAKLYRTGDIARYRSDGQIVHLGRSDHQVKIRGFRIELGEIETVLSRHQAVRQVVVAAREDRQGMKQLVAYVVPVEGRDLNQVELRSFARATLPDYMVPSLFVSMRAFPMTANNKIDVRALPATETLGASADQTRVHARNRLEVQLTALWQQVLGVQDISINDNFFELGGHSLKAAQLFFLLEEVFGKQLPLATLFQAPTIADLAEILARENWTPPWQSLVAIQPSGSAPPLFMVPGVGGNVLVFAKLAKLLGTEQPIYGLQARGLDGKETPFLSVSEMAIHYVQAIRQVCPNGPYRIVGVCTGGLIAYEMAQQLTAQGHTATIVMLDTWHPDSYVRYKRRLFNHVLMTGVILGKIRTDIREVTRSPIREWWPSTKRKSKVLMSLLSQSVTDHIQDNDFQVQRLTQATLLAVARYRVQQAASRIINVVASRNHVQDGIPDTRHKWQELGGKDSCIHYIPAENSGRMFVSPYVEELAQHMEHHFNNEVENATSNPSRCVSGY